MNKTEQSESSPPITRWPRRLLISALVLLGVIVLLLAYIWHLDRAGELKLKQTMAELDRTDPGWRWEEIERARAVVPDSLNSALQVVRVKSLLGTWDGGSLDEALNAVDARSLLNETQAKLLEAELAICAPALEEARRLADMPNGRFPGKRGSSPTDVLLDYVTDVRVVTRLLAYDAIAQANRGSMDAAVGSIHAGLNASRSIADEPTIIAQLVRIACRSIPIRRLERVLAQGEATDSALSRLQLATEKDEADPFYLYAIRGERAFHALTYQVYKINPAEFRKSMREGSSTGKYQLGPFDFEDTAQLLFEEGFSGQFSDSLRMMTEVVEIARLPLEEQRADLVKLEATISNAPRLVRNLMPAIVSVHDACLRSHAESRCAIAALAAERYRLAHGGWPDSLAALVEAKLLPKMPIDPYANTPILLRREPEGLVIYSVGPDGTDNNGNLLREVGPLSSGHDVGFRLWDVKYRRRP